MEQLWYYGKNYDAMEKLWYYTEHYGTSIYEGKKHGRLPKPKKLWFIIVKTMVIYQNNGSFWKKL